MGMILFGMVLGLFAAVGGFSMGASLWACLALYSSGGVIAVFSLLLLRLARDSLKADTIEGAPLVRFF